MRPQLRTNDFSKAHSVQSVQEASVGCGLPWLPVLRYVGVWSTMATSAQVCGGVVYHGYQCSGMWGVVYHGYKLIEINRIQIVRAKTKHLDDILCSRTFFFFFNFLIT